jgi:uncharacterized phiE125 gp8 family phage protein
MRVFVVTPPAPVVTWEEADEHLRLDGDTDQQPYIEGLLAAATGHLDGPDGWLGRALGVQTLEARLDWFGCLPITLPFPPLIDLVSVKYIDADGVEQTLATDQYVVRGNRFWPAYDVTFPTPRNEPEAVRIRYRAGYVQDAMADPLVAALPAPIRAAVLLMTEDLYKNRGGTIVGRSVAAVPMSTTVENLLGPFRVYG